MANLFSLLSWSTVAILLASFNPNAVTALSLHSREARFSPNHGELARRMFSEKRTKRCKPRTTVSSVPAATSSTAKNDPTTTKAATSTSEAATSAPKPTSTSKSSSAPKPTSAPPAAGSVQALFPGKKLLAWGDEAKFLNDWNSLAQRAYTWSPTTNSEFSQFGVKSCPMFWGQKSLQEFQDKVLNSDAEVDCVLGFNEPELASQGNLDPGYAAQLWVDNIVPVKKNKGAFLGGPAVTSDTPTNTNWLDKFFNACKDQTGDPHCLVDFLPVHYYDISASGFISFLNMMHDKYQKPIVVTEFADHNFNGGNQASMDEVWDFAGQMKSFFETTEWIVGFAPFGCIPVSSLPDINKDNAIMGDDHKPTSLGQYYYS